MGVAIGRREQKGVARMKGPKRAWSLEVNYVVNWG